MKAHVAFPALCQRLDLELKVVGLALVRLDVVVHNLTHLKANFEAQFCQYIAAQGLGHQAVLSSAMGQQLCIQQVYSCPHLKFVAVGDDLFVELLVEHLELLQIGLALPGVRLVTWTIPAVINWCFDCKITWREVATLPPDSPSSPSSCWRAYGRSPR